MVKNIVENQHYIPKALLELFTNCNNRFFEVLLSSKKIYQTNPQDSMSARFIYEDDGLTTNTVEDFFARMEADVIPMFKGLITTVEDYKQCRINFERIRGAVEELLPIYLVFYYRSGALLTEFASIKLKDKIPLLSKKILNRQYIELLAETVKHGYKFAIIESDGDFLLSDQFVSTAGIRIKSNFMNISNRHIGMKETILLLPISSNYYAAYWHSEDRFFLNENEINNISEADKQAINRTIINNSYLKCIAEKEEDLLQVSDEYKEARPSQIYIGYQSGGTGGAIRKKEVFYNEIDSKAFDLMAHQPYLIPTYQKTGRNDKCPCGSNRKFKRCHGEIYERIKTPWDNIVNQDQIDQNIYYIPGITCIEKPIDQWFITK